MDLPHRLPTATADPRPATRQLADAVVLALSAPGPSLDAVRRAVVRYARGARDVAIAAEDMLAAIAPGVRRCLDPLPSARRAELMAYVEWWAIHGYYGAD